MQRVAAQPRTSEAAQVEVLGRVTVPGSEESRFGRVCFQGASFLVGGETNDVVLVHHSLPGFRFGLEALVGSVVAVFGGKQPV